MIFRLVFALLIGSFGTHFAVADTPISKGQYRVPVSSDLEPYANFTLESIKIIRSNNVVTLQYELPIELTGNTHQVLTFSGVESNPNKNENSNFTMSGPNGIGTCSNTAQILTCQMKMKDLQINAAEREKILQAKSSSKSELEARDQVALLFSSDPVGIVTYWLY